MCVDLAGRVFQHLPRFGPGRAIEPVVVGECDLRSDEGSEERMTDAETTDAEQDQDAAPEQEQDSADEQDSDRAEAQDSDQDSGDEDQDSGDDEQDSGDDDQDSGDDDQDSGDEDQDGPSAEVVEVAPDPERTGMHIEKPERADSLSAEELEKIRQERLDPENRPDNVEVDNTQRTFDTETGKFTDSDMEEDVGPFDDDAV